MALTVKSTPLLSPGNYSIHTPTGGTSYPLVNPMAGDRRTKATGPKKKRGPRKADVLLDNMPATVIS